MELCRTLKDREQQLDDLETDELLSQMEVMEREGTTFLNRQREDTKRVRYVAPAVVTVLTVLLMAGLIALMLYGFALEEDPVPTPLVVVLVAIPGVVIFGVLLAVAHSGRLRKERRTMPNSTDPKRPSRITPVFVAVCVIAVVFLIVGSILLAFLAMGGANAFALGFMALYVLADCRHHPAPARDQRRGGRGCQAILNKDAAAKSGRLSRGLCCLPPCAWPR